MQATLRLIDKAFERAGISVIDPQGQAFNPERHEAMATQDAPELAPRHGRGGRPEGLPAQWAGPAPGARIDRAAADPTVAPRPIELNRRSPAPPRHPAISRTYGARYPWRK